MASRRDFLRMSLLAGAAAAMPLDRMIALAGDLGVKPFQVPLAIPPVMKPTRRSGRDYYDVTMCKARQRILPGTKTTIWGFDGRFPGPTIKARRGREVIIRRKNALPVQATTHLHGGEVPWRSDGHPSLAIAPGQAYDFVYPNHQEAATLWYHDHLCKETSRNNYMGLSGLYIIEDDAEDDLNLPKGRYDIPLILQDRAFKANGNFKFHDHVDEVKGEIYLVNGRPMPFLKVANRKYRFRVLNASHTRGYTLALSTREPLIQIGSDQGLLAAPAPAANVPLWPAERAEFVIDFSKYPVGTEIVLLDQQDPLDPSGGRPIMQFRVDRQEQDTSSLPATLRSIERLAAGPDTVEREFDLSKNDAGRWVINGKPFDASRIDFKPRIGDTEIWNFRNLSSDTHPMHLHLVRFQILSRSNDVVPPGEMGWKDTVRVDPSANSVRIITRFEGYPGKYMFHCHNLAHEDHSMMGQMKVVKGDPAYQRKAPSSNGGYVGGGRPPAHHFRCDL